MLLKIKNLVMTTIGIFLVVGTTKAFAAPLMLSTSDNVGISFWLISMAMVASADNVDDCLCGSRAPDMKQAGQMRSVDAAGIGALQR